VNLLAFIPLYDPLTALFPGMSDHWLWLLIPLVVVISVVYKGTRIEKLASLPRDAAVMAAQTIIIMGIAALLLALGCWLYLRIPWNH